MGELGGEEESSEYGSVARKGVSTSGLHTVKRGPSGNGAEREIWDAGGRVPDGQELGFRS